MTLVPLQPRCMRSNIRRQMDASRRPALHRCSARAAWPVDVRAPSTSLQRRTTMSVAESVAELERLKVIRNGEKEQQTFSAGEMERRLSGLRTIMAEEGLDVVL